LQQEGQCYRKKNCSHSHGQHREHTHNPVVAPQRQLSSIVLWQPMYRQEQYASGSFVLYDHDAYQGEDCKRYHTMCCWYKQYQEGSDWTCMTGATQLGTASLKSGRRFEKHHYPHKTAARHAPNAICTLRMEPRINKPSTLSLTVLRAVSESTFICYRLDAGHRALKICTCLCILHLHLNAVLS
jgi:hypothetical protein